MLEDCLEGKVYQTGPREPFKQDTSSGKGQKKEQPGFFFFLIGTKPATLFPNHGNS